MAAKNPLSLFKRVLPSTKSVALDADNSEPREPMKITSQELSSMFVNLFPVWTALFAGAALYNPNLFLWLTTEYFTAGLALLMISMGITLTPKDFADVFSEDLPSVATQWLGC
eukprot:CAMPEP_0205936420 /NCGR_PEP_ID=MMETSP1325-20131115/41562_1 /ASSEMBLY_ACC=CAM_ASM_000708 /TAXON_ID=236786 /ORGANISM="Florenciella sp., Strain RCC1007" /LENGTH=112 /DNA_ID=CAMNT_0053306585 /DNA_START=1 /DNA_END=336 /DNA_ORIENTATION=+